MQAPRLSQNEIAAARRDTRYQPRLRRTDPELPVKMVTDSERTVASWLDELDIAYEYEDRFFPTFIKPNGIEFGFCPDFRLLATDEWPEQFLEVTEAKNSCLGPKRRKIQMAGQIYGIHICLIDLAVYSAISANPSALIDLLVVRPRQPALATQPSAA